jgi:hypothetical protein
MPVYDKSLPFLIWLEFLDGELSESTVSWLTEGFVDTTICPTADKAYHAISLKNARTILVTDGSSSYCGIKWICQVVSIMSKAISEVTCREPACAGRLMEMSCLAFKGS